MDLHGLLPPKQVSQACRLLKLNRAYTWTDENTLDLILRYIESPHTERMICHFDEKNIAVVIENSFAYGKKKTELKGILKE